MFWRRTTLHILCLEHKFSIQSYCLLKLKEIRASWKTASVNI
ncbi:hypothetical protein RJ641_011328 [Dillenia turbinata]|uniref:Uncharacterized protein n=1 Tax=Dillenia turbinata TaxID=194707 RepID=A0AAN8Z1J8_9MAGN